MRLILLLVGATALGWWVGSRPAFGKHALRMGRPVMLVALGLLLFGMGVLLGSRPEVVAQWRLLGLRAVSIAWAGAFGAICAVWLMHRMWNARR